MFKFTLRDGAVVLAAGVLIVGLAGIAVAISWLRNDPNTKAGSLRRGLDGVGKETDRRDREIEELTGSPVGR
ncbi:hypothetical protein ETAA8_45230 [Anatilimnocola aggregata]|uniref:Uncharacterized protein n=1 Tax=Anatilimnocola aggregata TaxID=2528021 RepID=A0A517YGQ7_9BACT|nr:hypothetical protein [Anatilimnocola aggregata]QDU29413.1 hypothetical protein ETAA8_45230 [Anatilimnocola aggregata]